jgi:hypothetical protein
MEHIPQDIIGRIADFCDIDVRIALVGVRRFKAIPELQILPLERNLYAMYVVLRLPSGRGSYRRYEYEGVCRTNLAFNTTIGDKVFAVVQHRWSQMPNGEYQKDY